MKTEELVQVKQKENIEHKKSKQEVLLMQRDHMCTLLLEIV